MALGRVVLHMMRQSAMKCWVFSRVMCGASAMDIRVKLLSGLMRCAGTTRVQYWRDPPFWEGGKERVYESRHTPKMVIYYGGGTATKGERG